MQTWPGNPANFKAFIMSIGGPGTVRISDVYTCDNELRFYVELALPCTNLLKFCILILRYYG